jgi:hypothetical protein
MEEQKKAPAGFPAGAKFTQESETETVRANGTEQPEQTEASRPAFKRVADLRALLAFAGGHVVHELAPSGFLVTWRGHHKHCADLAKLEAHARRVGALK